MSFSDAHDVATEALETFHKIEDGAARLLAARSGEASDALAVINTFTNTAAVATIASIGDDTTKSLLSLVREPAISRVVAETDEGKVVTYYICRTTNITVKGTMLAGYRTPIGRLAVFDVGESVELEVAGRQRGYRILEKLELKPLKSDDLWDATDSIWRRRRTTPQTIPSLRKLVQPVDDNSFLAMLGGDSEADKILEGVVHQIRRAMALRDQAILDKIQDEIFRLSIDHQLIILGPPGTGKTTTLIKRIGQKLDVQALSPDEQRLLGPATNRQRWMMFTPSDLLKHYVKEAFNRENVPASDDHIKTWNKRRHDLARSTFGILRTGNSGSCILKEDRRYSSFSVSDDPRQWFADFKAYHLNRLLTSLREGAGLLKDSAPNLSDPVVKELLTTVGELSPEGLLGAYATWSRIESRIEPLLKTSRGTTDKLIQQQGSLLYNKNNAVFVELANALRMAAESRGRPVGVMFHSDQGCQYASHKFRATLDEYNLNQSMSHRGQCWDNAAMERFFGALKSEWMPAEGYETEAQARVDIQAYLMRYNLKRLHSYNGYETPVAMEEKLKIAA